MFRTFTQPQAIALFDSHPSAVAVLLETAWNARSTTGTLGYPDNRSALTNIAIGGIPIAVAPGFPGGNPIYDHLIYAYMIENTRIVEIFRRVVREFVHGERLGTPSTSTQNWLRNTEDLFFKDPLSYGVTSLVSYVRPDPGANRRNAYQRVFGMDLNHGTDEGMPYPFLRADASNQEFASTLEEFLREVWVGIVNVFNFVGARPIDNPKIETLKNKLREMLLSRRLQGNLSREEFAYVSMMSWFHLSVRYDALPLIQDLKAIGLGEEQRLYKVAQQVRLPAHGLSRSYFRIAERISTLLNLIELDVFAGNPQNYYTTIGVLAGEIITEWSTITGRDLKGQRVLPFAPSTGPIPSPGIGGRQAPASSLPVSGAPSTNGSSAVPAPIASRLTGVETT